MKVVQGLLLAALVAFVAARAWEVLHSREGLWTAYPHSGFRPESRNYELRITNYELENSAPTARGRKNER